MTISAKSHVWTHIDFKYTTSMWALKDYVIVGPHAGTGRVNFHMKNALRKISNPQVCRPTLNDVMH